MLQGSTPARGRLVDDTRQRDDQQHEAEASDAPPVEDFGQFTLLRRADQGCIAVVIVVSILAIIGNLAYHALRGHRLVDIERIAPQEIPFKLDVNKADWPEWTLLPGIGETLAKRVVELRDARGGEFHEHKDLLKVKGIGPRTFERIQPYLLPIEAKSSEPPTNGARMSPASEGLSQPGAAPHSHL